MSSNEPASPLKTMTESTKSELWNDSCSVSELNYALEHGAVGATSNPVIAGEVLRKELEEWEPVIKRIIAENPTADEDQITWKIVEEVSIRAAELLVPIHSAGDGRNGRLSIQVDPRYYRDVQRMVEQAKHFDSLAPNIIVKLPVTQAGVKAIEEVTYHGVSINATISFTVPQALAVAEAVEKGMMRREAEGKDTSSMGPVCTIMVGRVDDWLKVVADKYDIITEPGYLEWAGVAVMKNAYSIYQERGYRTRLLSAATRNHAHWSEFIGGDVAITLTHQWQKRFNSSTLEAIPRMHTPVDAAIVSELHWKFEDFRKAYDPEGMTHDEFDNYGATRRTLRSFIEGYHDLVSLIRNYMIPDPD